MPAAINPDKIEKTMFSIPNSRCSYCSRVIEHRLKAPGVKDAPVSYLTDTVLVPYDPEKTTTRIIRESIRKIGYNALVHH